MLLNNLIFLCKHYILTQGQALKTIESSEKVKEWVYILLQERTKLIESLQTLSIVQHIYPTDSNFVLVKVNDANSTYNYLVEKGIIVRNRSSVSLCMGCLRITVGTPEENQVLIQALNSI